MGKYEGTKDAVANHQRCETNVGEEVSTEYLDAGFHLEQTTVRMELTESNLTLAKVHPASFSL